LGVCLGHHSLPAEGMQILLLLRIGLYCVGVEPLESVHLGIGLLLLNVCVCNRLYLSLLLFCLAKVVEVLEVTKSCELILDPLRFLGVFMILFFPGAEVESHSAEVLDLLLRLDVFS